MCEAVGADELCHRPAVAVCAVEMWIELRLGTRDKELNGPMVGKLLSQCGGLKREDSHHGGVS